MKLLAVIGRVSLAISLIALINPTYLHHPAQAAPQSQGQAIAQIASPAEGQTLTGLVAVSGSADHPEFARWELAYGPDPNPNDAWQPFATGDQPILNGTIGTWNTGVIADGRYALRLRVIRADSNYDEAFVRGLQVSNSAPVGTPTSIPPVCDLPGRTVYLHGRRSRAAGRNDHGGAAAHQCAGSAGSTDESTPDQCGGAPQYCGCRQLRRETIRLGLP